jgi:hypothetical protein
MKTFVTLLFLSLFLCFTKAVAQINFTAIYELELKNHIEPFYQSSHSEFFFYNNSIYISSDQESVLAAFSLNDGEQILYENIQGEGPFELSTIYNVFVDDEGIFLGDYSGKIIKFDHNMTPINQWNTDYVRTNDLVHFNNQILIANESPSEDYYLNLFDINDNNYSYLTPEQKNENILFSAFKEAGNLLYFGNKIYSIKPFGNDLYIYNLSGIDTPKSISLQIPNFKSESAGQNIQAYYSDIQELRNFFEKNSLVTNIFKLKDMFAIEVLHMHRAYERELVLFDKDFNLLCFSLLPEKLDGLEDSKFHFSDKEYLYVYREEIHNGNDFRIFVTAYNPVCQ